MSTLFDDFRPDEPRKRKTRPRTRAAQAQEGDAASLKNRPKDNRLKIEISKNETIVSPGTVAVPAIVDESIRLSSVKPAAPTPPLDMTPTAAMYVAANLLSIVLDAPACMLASTLAVGKCRPDGDSSGESKPRRRLTPELYADLFRQLLTLEQQGWPDAAGKRDGFDGKPLMMTAAEIAVVKERWARIDEFAAAAGWRCPHAT